MEELDDLHEPHSCIKAAQILAARLWHADECLFMVNGTTSAVQAMIFGTLATGDYSVRGYEGEFTVERKSLPDLVRSVTHDRERFVRELERMRAFEFRRLLVVAPFGRVRLGDCACGGYSFSAANPRAVLASLTGYVCVVLCGFAMRTPARCLRR